MTPSFWLARGCLLNEGSSNPTAEASLTDGPAPRTGRFLDLDGRPRVPRPSCRSSAFSRGARLKVRSMAEGAGSPGAGERRLRRGLPGGSGSGGVRGSVSPRAGGAQQVSGSARSRAEHPGGPASGGAERVPGTFCPPWNCERPRPWGLPAAARHPARSACARRRPSPTSARRRFLVPGSWGPSVPGETRRRSPTPAGAARSHAPAAAAAPERTA